MQLREEAGLQAVEKRLAVLRRLCLHDPLTIHEPAPTTPDSAPGSCLGLSLHGCVITSIAPGGPAFLTRQLSETDRVVEVDGHEAQDGNVGRLMRGDGLDGSVCSVKVLKTAQSRIGQEGQVVEVEVRRGRESVIGEVTKAFDLVADVGAHARYCGGEVLVQLVDEVGRQIVKALLDKHDRQELLSRQHAEVREESMRCLTGVQESLSSMASALAESQGRVSELEGKVERYVLLGEERKRLVKALEQQLSIAQEHERELEERLEAQKDAVSSREDDFNLVFRQTTGHLEGKVAELQQHLLNVSRELVEAKGHKVTAEQESQSKEEAIGRMLEGQTRMVGDMEELQRIAAESEERCGVLEAELRSARERETEASVRTQDEVNSAVRRVEEVLRGEIEMVREEGKKALAAEKRSQEDTNASLDSALTRNRELAAQCGWLEELVAAKVKEVAALSEKTGYAPVTQAPPPEVMKRQMEGELLQLKSALQAREAQILSLERNMPPTDSADHSLMATRKAELDRAKAEMFDARQEILSLEREIQQASPPQQPLTHQPNPLPQLHATQHQQAHAPDQPPLRPPPSLQQPIFPPTFVSPSKTPAPGRQHTPQSSHQRSMSRTPARPKSPQSAFAPHQGQRKHQAPAAPAPPPQQVYRPGWGGQQDGGEKRPVGLAGVLIGHDTTLFSF